MGYKKIALINGGLSGGGAERFTVTFANALQQDSNYLVYLLTSRKQENEYPLSKDVSRYCILTKSFLKNIFIVRNFLIKNDIDTAVAIGIYCNLILCAANILLKTKVIISERNAPQQDKISFFSKVLRKCLYWNADFYIFQTKGAQSFYSKQIQKRSAVIHNPVIENLPQRSDVCIKEIVAVGRLMPQKNYPLLINAFANVVKTHPEYKLRIFGQGILLPQLQELTEKLKLTDKIIFEGFCSNVHQAIKDSDIFVMTSDFEGMPNSLMEAMAMGFPVISTDCPAGGPAELIQNDRNGLLVKVRDVKGLVDSILRLIEDNDLKIRLQTNAKNIRNTHCTTEIIKAWKRVL
jgi:glycosyltransferase involved in cell wall biosynthesis